MSRKPEPKLDTWLSLGSYEDVLNSDFDYWSVRKELLESGMEMIKILKIHNRNLRDRFEEETEHFKKSKSPGFDVNIQYLYHGTKSPLDKICEEGLDERESPSGHFGRGIYFSENPAMCRVYCEDASSSSNEHYVVRCRVILGESKVYTGGNYDPGLTREPRKDDAKGKIVYYDSVKGQVGPYTQFVVYEKRRVNIQYVVYYKTTNPIPTLPPVPSAKHSSSHKHRHHRQAAAVTTRPRTPSPGSLQRPRTPSPGSLDRPPSEDERPPSEDERPPSEDERPPSELSDDEPYVRRRASSVSSEDGAVGGVRRISISDEPEVSETTSKSTVQKVSCTRNRTRRLVQSGLDATHVQPVASGESLPAQSVKVTNNKPVGHTRRTVDEEMSPAAAAHRQAIQESAVKKLLELKGQVPDDRFNDLLTSYTLTYGHLPAQSGPGSTALQAPVLDDDDGSDDVRKIVDNLVAEFEQFVPGVDRLVARQYIEQYNMDLQHAVDAYFDDNL